MAAAIRLAVAGLDVQVFEKNDYPGGKLSAFSLNGFHFDAGPSLFTEPWLLQELFELSGEDISDFLHIRPVKKACTYIFREKVIDAWTDRDQFADELERKVGEPAVNVHRYLKRSEKLYKGAAAIFLNESLHRPSTWLKRKTIRSLFATPLSMLRTGLHDHNRKEFRTAEACQIFDRFATYNGSDPFRTPAIMSVIPHLEHNTGIWYPDGGMISITDALYRLALKKGVRFHFGSEVTRIIHSGGTASGIVVEHVNIPADVVISNMDVYFTYKKLLLNDHAAKKNAKQERSSSALVFYWGMNREFPMLGLHNIFFSEDYKKEFQGIFKNSIPDDVTVYINITSRENKEHAPAGMENWFVMINVPSNRGQNWTVIKERVRRLVLSKLEKMLGTDVEQHIIEERVMDPVKIASDTMSYQGALYGTSSNSAMAAFVRHSNYAPGVKGLYFCGGSVHPGGGIPLCFRSAAIATGMIKRKLNVESR